MKIIHTGDIHIGSAFKNFPPDKARLRQAELLENFGKLTRYAKESGVFAVLISGDLFDGSKIEPRFIKETLSLIAAASPARFFYVSGNHDEGISLMEQKPDNLFLFSQNRGFGSVELAENVVITGMDSPYFSQESFSSLYLNRDKFNIVMLHGDVEGGLGAEKIPLPVLQNKGIDYLALGHIHLPTTEKRRLDGRGFYRYCGCLEGRGFDEVGARGFFLLEIERGAIVNEKFLSFSKRAVFEYFVDISACQSYFDVERETLKTLAGAPRENVILLTLCGNHKIELRKDISLLLSRLLESFFFVKIEDKSKPFFDYNAYQNELGERGEFIREAGRYEMSEELRAEVLEVGLKALSGEEIDL